MPEPKTNCSKCGTEILQKTAERTGGLCMPCKNPPKLPDPNEPVEVSCSVQSRVPPDPILFTSAQDLLRVLEITQPMGPVPGDSLHANHFELEAQRALLRHAIKYRVKFRLNDDHWRRTGFALLHLFEAGKATMQRGDQTYHFEQLIKEEWQEGTDSFAMVGGFLYRDCAGTLLYKRDTWRS